MIFYDNVDVVINGSGILAQSANISQVNYLDPAYILEKRGEMSQPVKDSIRSKLGVRYLVQVDYEPCLAIVDSIKKFRTDDHIAPSFVVEVANISGSFYLEDYSMSIQPNQTVDANATFVSYEPLTGDIGEKRDGENAINYTPEVTPGVNQQPNLAHGWTTFVTDSSTARSFPIYKFDYQFRAQWNPIYTMGHKFPRQVQLLNAGEMLVLERDNFKHITFSGEKAETGLTEYAEADGGDGDFNIDVVQVNLLCEDNIEWPADIADIASYPHLEISISGGIIVNSRLDVTVGEALKSKIGINKNY
jgi:hypothetical protein